MPMISFAISDMLEPRQFLFLTAVLLSTLLAGSALAYDSPNFDHQIIDTDALMLSPNDRESIVEALNAIACNFPTSKLIDEDLREKALAIALTLDPLNVNSRTAHYALLAGKNPPTTAFFQTSVSEVSERLWAEASKMTSKKVEPERQKLALYLEELSLVLHPSAPVDRIKAYAKNTDEEELPWKRFTTLQPQENPSNSKIKELFKDAKAAPLPKPSAVAKITKEATPPAKPVPEPPRADRRPKVIARNIGDVSEIKLPTVEIPVVTRGLGVTRKETLGGTMSLTIREAEKTDAALFEVTEDFPAPLAAQMKLAIKPESFQIAGFDRAERLVRLDFPRWPEKMIAELRFDTDLEATSSRPLTSINGTVAVSLLLHSAFSGEKPDQNIIYAGFFDNLTKADGPSFSVGSRIADVLDQAKQMNKEFVLIPDQHFETMVEGAVTTRQLEYLFDPQIISYSSWETLKDTAFGAEAEARETAAAEFKKIQAVQDQLPLVDLSRNAKVRERLDKIVADYPQHLSARIMLAFGATPDDPSAMIRESIQSIDATLEPFISEIVEAAEDGTAEDLDFSILQPDIESADKALLGLQNGVAPEVRNYLFTAKAFINDLRSLISSSSNTSTTANQRLQVVQKSLSELQLERVAIGLERFK